MASKSVARKCASGICTALADDVAVIEARLAARPVTLGGHPSWSGTAPRSFERARPIENARPFVPTHSRPAFGKGHAYHGPAAMAFGGYGYPAPVPAHQVRRSIDSAYVEADFNFFRSHRFGIDALNVCYWGNGSRKGNHPCLENVIALTRELDRRGAEWMAFWDPFNPKRFSQPGEARRWEQLMRNDPERQIQVEGMKGDLACLMYASKPSPSGLPAILITDDKYRDHAATLNFPIASDRRRFLPGTKVNGELWFPTVQWAIKVI